MDGWYADFLEQDLAQLEDLIQVILAANYLDVPTLLELACAELAWQI